MITSKPTESDGRFFWLLVSLLALFLIFPLIEQLDYRGMLVELIFSLILLSSVRAVSAARGRVFTAIFTVALLSFVVRWASRLISHAWLQIFGDAFAAIFLAVAAGLILAHLLEIRTVSTQQIYGGICVYLLLGMTWSFLYSILVTLDPGALQMAPSTSPIVLQLVYFSFVTITTLGYGDIAPVSAVARSLAILEAVVGQLFLAVFIARLVGMHLVSGEKK